MDLVYNAVPDNARRVFKVISSAVLVVLLVISLPAAWDYVTFMKREHTASLRIPINYLYSVYLIFSVACILRHCRLIWISIRGTASEPGSAKEADPA